MFGIALMLSILSCRSLSLYFNVSNTSITFVCLPLILPSFVASKVSLTYPSSGCGVVGSSMILSLSTYWAVKSCVSTKPVAGTCGFHALNFLFSSFAFAFPSISFTLFWRSWSVYDVSFNTSMAISLMSWFLASFPNVPSPDLNVSLT